MKWILLTGLLILMPLACTKRMASEKIVSFSQSDFPVREGTVGSERFKFRIYIPKDRKPEEKLPVMLYLHGSDDRGHDDGSQLRGLAPLIMAAPENFRFAIVFPHCEARHSWDKDTIAMAMVALDQTVKEFNGDETRLYLAGFSLGGYGTWMAAAMFPDKFAAIVPMSGRIMPRLAERINASPEVVELFDAPDPYAAFANRLRNIPVWVFHGTNDPIVPVDGSRKMVDALKAAGNVNVKFSELEGAEHDSLHPAFNDPEFFKWLAEQSLNNNQ